MDQARLEKYAGWLVQNKDKKGTPEFETVAKAYKTLRTQGTSDTPKNYAASEVPGSALANAPASLGKNIAGVVEGVANAVVHPIETAGNAYGLIQGATEHIPGADAINDWGEKVGLAKPRNKKYLAEQKDLAAGVAKDYKDAYGGWENIKRTVAEDPFRPVMDAASLVTGGELAAAKVPTLAKVATSGAKKSAAKVRALNKLKVSYPEAAPAVAEDLQRLSKTGGYNLDDISSSNQGAKGALAKSFTDNKVEIDADYRTLRKELDPDFATSEADRKLRVEAEKAFKSGDHMKMDHVTPDQIKAVETLVGHTAQGARIVHNLKKTVEVSRLHDDPMVGISKYTDIINPLNTKSYAGIRGIIPALSAGLGYQTMGTSLAAQLGVVAAGRLIDKPFGGSSRAAKYAKQNAPKAPMAPVGDGLPDVQVERRLAQEAEAKAQAQAKATKDAEKATKEAERAKTDEARQMYKEAKMEDVYRSAAARKTLEAKNALEKMQKPEAATVIPKEAVDQVHWKMEVRKNSEAAQAALEKATKASAAKEAKAKLAEAKAADKVKEKSSTSNSFEDERRKKIWNDGKVRIQEHEKTVSETASKAKDKHLSKLLEEGLDKLNQTATRGKKNHGNRLSVYISILEKAKTPNQRRVLREKLYPLARYFDPNLETK